MFANRQRLPLIVMAAVAATLIVLIIPVGASSTTSTAAGAETGGFRALNGMEAKNFEIPSDMVLATQEALKTTSSGAQLSVERYRQYFGDAEVLGGQMTVYGADGETLAVIGGHYDNLSPQNMVALSANEAQKAARDQLGRGGEWFTQLMLNPESERFYYEVENKRYDSRWFYWIDAEDGSIVNAYDGLAHGSGTGVLGDIKDLSGLTTNNGGQYQLISADGRQTTYDARNRSRLPGVLATDGDDDWDSGGRTSPGHPAMVDAHFYARITDGYFQSTHSFDWLNYYPQGMVSSAHVKRNYNNAYWNGSQMAYGDGDGLNFIELSGDLDVVGHELTHGVTDATSDLIYQNESGALNEAFSDIMGTAIEFSFGTGNWTVGEDITPGDNGIRNMADPGEDGDPSHYAERYTGTGDNGGVHINSGIANHWFYLLVNGGQNSDPGYASGQNVQRIGIAAAENIAFLGFTALTATSDFCQARDATISIAGSSTANVADAWDEVGVDDALCSGSGDPGPGTGPVISNVSSRELKGTKFEITWNTDVASTSKVTFACCGDYSESQLVTSHKMNFRGSNGATYDYYVTSVDANGNSSTEGPFTHQN
jgi:bacillolysin